MGAKENYEARKASDKAKGEADRRDRWWFNQRAPIDQFTGWLVAWTALLFLATIVNAGILWLTDHTLRDTLIANNRAWVWPEVEIAGDLDLTKREFPITVTLTNTGPAPATHVNVELYMNPSPSIPVEGIDEFCKKALRDRANSFNAIFRGRAIFPQRTIQEKSAADIWPEKFKAARAALHTPRSAGYIVVISVCVYYKFAVGRDTYRLTSRRFILVDSDKYTRGTAPLNPRKMFIAREKLRLEEDLFGSGFAE